MPRSIVIVSLVAFVAACGIPKEEHDQVVAQLADARAKLAETGGKLAVAETGITNWKEAAQLSVVGTTNIVEVWKLVKENAADCAKLEAALDTRVAAGVAAKARARLDALTAALAKEKDFADGLAHWKTAVQPLNADIDAAVAPLATACPDKTAGIGQKITLALKGHVEAPAAAPAAPAAAPAAPAAAPAKPAAAPVKPATK